MSLLCVLALLTARADRLFEHLDDEQMFLNAPTFYLPQFRCDMTLPNGIRLRYLEEEEVVPPSLPSFGKSMEMYEWDAALNYMVLVDRAAEGRRNVDYQARTSFDAGVLFPRGPVDTQT